MHGDPSDDALIGFYERTDESVRLTAGVGLVELLRTQVLVRDRIGSNERIVDVGGADGVHATWLIGDGHDVEIVDLVPRHVDRARRRGLRAHVGDARSLPHEDASFDVVLLLGPLYHLPSALDRAACLDEARRVLRPGGIVAAAGCGRLGVALDRLRTGRFDEPGFQQAAERIVTIGRDDSGYGGGLFFFHAADELHDELASAGFDDIVVRGVEGPAWPLLGVDGGDDEQRVADVVAIAELADREPASVATSIHLLALGTR